jgi:hypothetical protein
MLTRFGARSLKNRRGRSRCRGFLNGRKQREPRGARNYLLRFIRCLMFKSFLWMRCGINRAKSRIVLRQLTLNYGQKRNRATEPSRTRMNRPEKSAGDGQSGLRSLRSRRSFGANASFWAGMREFRPVQPGQVKTPLLTPKDAASGPSKWCGRLREMTPLVKVNQA